MLILSADVFNERSGTVIAVALTSQEPRAGFPLTLELTARGRRQIHEETASWQLTVALMSKFLAKQTGEP